MINSEITNERIFENFICNMHKYNYLFKFLKEKIGHDCARKIIMMNFRNDKIYGDVTNINEYHIRKRSREENLRRPPLKAMQKIEINSNSYFNKNRMEAPNMYWLRDECPNIPPSTSMLQNYIAVNRFFIEHGFKYIN